MLVEDEADYATLLEIFLAEAKDYQFKIEKYYKLRDALLSLEKNTPDIIILDLHLLS